MCQYLYLGKPKYYTFYLVRTKDADLLNLLPSATRTVSTLGSLPVSMTGLGIPLYHMMEVRAMTLKPAILDRVEMSSSVMPSEKYSSLGSGLIFVKGRTARR